MKKYVFDSSALISFLDGEPNALIVAGIFEEIRDRDLEAHLCVINLGEVYYHFLRTGGEKTANTALESIQTLPLNIQYADEQLTLSAARTKAFNKMSYADCFAAALAKQTNAYLVSSDKEFKQIEKEIRIYWI